MSIETRRHTQTETTDKDTKIILLTRRNFVELVVGGTAAAMLLDACNGSSTTSIPLATPDLTPRPNNQELDATLIEPNQYTHTGTKFTLIYDAYPDPQFPAAAVDHITITMDPTNLRDAQKYINEKNVAGDPEQGSWVIVEEVPVTKGVDLHFPNFPNRRRYTIPLDITKYKPVLYDPDKPVEEVRQKLGINLRGKDPKKNIIYRNSAGGELVIYIDKVTK